VQMTPTRRLVFSTLALAASCVAVLGQSLESRIQTLVTKTDLGGATVGVAVFDVDSGQLIAGDGADQEMIPASNMKLITTGAALFTLGPDFAFRTEFLIQESEGHRTLIIKGDGDPALGDPELLGRGSTPLDVNGLLERVAEALQRRGIDHLDEVIVDDRVFARETLHPAWPRDQLNRWYCAEVAGLNFHTNVVTVFPQSVPGSLLPRLTVEPAAPWIEIKNQSRSVSNGPNTVWISRPDRTNTMTVFGEVRRRAEIPVAIANPAEFAGRVIATALQSNGIEIGPAGSDPVSHVRLVGEDEKFEGAETAAVVRTTLADVLNRCNTDSHNLYAEALLKRTGHAVTGDSGSWSNGAAVVRMLLGEKLGPTEATQVTVSDGSGMSRENRVSPRILASWIGEIYEDDSVREALLASMAGPGEGTLRERFRDAPLNNRLEAKSGYLTGVYALSGLLINDDGRAVTFSILLNDVPSGKAARNAKPLHQDIVVEIDRWLTAQKAGALGG
jgi:D-alanyl-D-alanine carboxypeptidase/D-alanyl-D-alanine-endopeptidase (penicillin-binding protein 4)